MEVGNVGQKWPGMFEPKSATVIKQPFIRLHSWQKLRIPYQNTNQQVSNCLEIIII